MANAEDPTQELPPIVTPRQAAGLAVKGLCMGTADIIPGVSGGTVALILGVYARLVEGIRAWRPATVLALLRALPGVTDPARRGELVAALRALHVDFLVPLGLGIVTAVGVAARFIPQLLERYPAHMSGLFFGLILGSIYVPFAAMKHRSPLHLALGGLAAAAAYVLVGLPVLTGPASLPFIFLCGAIAICAMILPGVSGSYMLKVLGQYENILTALHERDLVTIGVFVFGITVGITTFVRVLSWLLRRYESSTLAVLTGLMIGSLRSVWPFKEAGAGGRLENVLPSSFGGDEAVIVGIVLLGVAIVTGLIVADRKLGAKAG